MLDTLLLRGLRNGNEKALSQVIEKYTAYVCTIIRNTVREALTREDIEEIASDVFLALWENADKIDRFKPYMAATARNKARNKLRSLSGCLPLDDETLVDEATALEQKLIVESERQVIKDAVLNMEDTDRDIFLRHYYNSQTISEIARETHTSEASVKQRLSRGRKKLKLMIKKEAI